MDKSVSTSSKQAFRYIFEVKIAVTELQKHFESLGIHVLNCKWVVEANNMQNQKLIYCSPTHKISNSFETWESERPFEG